MIISKSFFISDMTQFLMGKEDWNFIPEIVLRTLIMFLILLFSLRLLGKRGVKQLSVFELVVIISLGSAAGDPMFYKEVGLIAALVVFVVIVVAYKLISTLVNRSKTIESILEGTATCLIEEGKFSIENVKKEALAQDEFFSELRLKSISHLGQVKLAIIETSGSISVFFYENTEVKYGLPILPSLFCNTLKEIKQSAHYSCSFCGYTTILKIGDAMPCKACGKREWVKSINNRRIN